MSYPKLGVNIDHVASLRQLRGADEPQPVIAALACLDAGADSIVVHLREDRRHINDDDLGILKRVIKKKLNLEMSVNKEIVDIACRVGPDQATLVPEKRQEVTTEGGLDVAGNLPGVRGVVDRLRKSGIKVSLFIDPVFKQIDASVKSGVEMIELHTGKYAGAGNKKEEDKYFKQLEGAVKYARAKGLDVNAGHGLDYYNVGRVAGIKGIAELNIGYAIVCRAVLVGIKRAVREMEELIKGQGRGQV